MSYTIRGARAEQLNRDMLAVQLQLAMEDRIAGPGQPRPPAWRAVLAAALRMIAAAVER